MATLGSGKRSDDVKATAAHQSCVDTGDIEERQSCPSNENVPVGRVRILHGRGSRGRAVGSIEWPHR